MREAFITCFFCGKNISRRQGWINENIKLNHTNYCSLKCLGESKTARKTLLCENVLCKREFKKIPSQISSHNFCSRSCAAVVNNKKFPKRIAQKKTCKRCGKLFKGSAIKYCSIKCQALGAQTPKEKLLELIIRFNKENGRIPFKSEFLHYHAVRSRFGTWNNAIKIAGFEPNPIMFAKKYIAKDGHKCDSLSEKIIDDWLYARKISHEINHPYPGDLGLTVDFKVREYWIEFFGLSGRHKRYDELKKLKLKLAKKEKLNLISVYPHNLFPKSSLEKVLARITN